MAERRRGISILHKTAWNRLVLEGGIGSKLFSDTKLRVYSTYHPQLVKQAIQGSARYQLEDTMVLDRNTYPELIRRS
jgi:hypothetical protein